MKSKGKKTEMIRKNPRRATSGDENKHVIKTQSDAQD